MLELIYHKKSYLLPESYNELTGNQLIEINKLLLLRNVPIEMLRLKLLRILLGLSLYRFFKIPADCKHRMLFDENESGSRIDWVFEKNTLTKQLIPKYNGFYGPKKEFDNLRVKEFHVCEMAYYDYLQEGKEEDLNKLVAVLYRPAKKGYDFKKDSDGDCRVEFNANELDYNIKIIASWPAEVKYSIVIFYDANREYLRTLYEDVFSSTSDNDEKDVNEGMYQVIRNLSGNRYGTFKEVENMLLHDVMREIVSSIEDEKKQEELLKTNQP